MIRASRFVAIMLAALALSLTSAHVLEMPQKLQYDADLYAQVNTTMYRYFAIVGGIYSMGAIAATAVLTLLLRGRGATFRWTAAATGMYVLWFASWLAAVVPVNRRIAEAMSLDPGAVPMLWQALRARWEYGHAIGFGLEAFGFAALAISVLVDTPGPASNSD